MDKSVKYDLKHNILAKLTAVGSWIKEKQTVVND